MERLKYERFIAGNQELRNILLRAEALEKRRGSATAEDLKSIWDRLLNLTPKVGEASRSETLDVRLLDEVAEYVKNLRALQQVIEKIRCAPADRRATSDAVKRQLESVQDLVPADLQTA